MRIKVVFLSEKKRRMIAAKKKIEEALQKHYTLAECRTIALILLETVLHKSRAELLAEWDRELTVDENRELEEKLYRLEKAEPLQYVLGECTFAGLIFRVSPAVLIPRPETEELVRLIAREEAYRTSCTLLDIGTGSGCIAVSLAQLLPKSQVSAIDISNEALDVARENAELNNVQVSWNRMDILQEELLSQWDIIVSNPPYVLEKEKEDMSANVLDYEPGIALFVPDTSPLLYYERIARQAIRCLRPEGKIYFEINEAYGRQISELLHSLGFDQVECLKDCYGKERIVKAKQCGR